MAVQAISSMAWASAPGEASGCCCSWQKGKGAGGAKRVARGRREWGAQGSLKPPVPVGTNSNNSHLEQGSHSQGTPIQTPPLVGDQISACIWRDGHPSPRRTRRREWPGWTEVCLTFKETAKLPFPGACGVCFPARTVWSSQHAGSGASVLEGGAGAQSLVRHSLLPSCSHSAASGFLSGIF